MGGEIQSQPGAAQRFYLRKLNMTKALQDDKGNPSSLRIMAMIALLTGCATMFLGVFKGNADAIQWGAIIVSIAIGGKAAQKFGEKQ